MKHLKLFESIEKPLLKKYCVWIDNNSSPEILEITGSRKKKNDEILYSSISIYQLQFGKLVKLEGQMEIPFGSDCIDDYVPYTSDNLQDCIDMLLAMLYSNKYNI